MVTIALVLLVCLPLHGLWRLVGLRSPWPRRFLGTLARIAGAEIHIVGQPLLSHVLYAANHISWLDILVLAGATGTRFVAKDSISRWPLVGWLATLNRTVFVARAKRGSVHDQATSIREALADPCPLALFPEGHTADGKGLDPFRASLFAAVVPPPPGLRVQPVAIDYGSDTRLVAWPDELNAGEDAMRLLGLPGRRRVTLRLGDPIDPALLCDRKAIAAQAQAQVAEALGEERRAGV